MLVAADRSIDYVSCQLVNLPQIRLQVPSPDEASLHGNGSITTAEADGGKPRHLDRSQSAAGS